MPKSDLPYVQAGAGLERANPVFNVSMTEWTNLSGSIQTANDSFELFAEDDASQANSRFLAHIGTEGSLWVNFLGGNAGPNMPGSLELIPGDILPIPTRGAVTLLGTEVGIPFTAAQG